MLSRVVMQMHMFSDMVTDTDNVRLRGQELCEYFQKVVSDEGAMTHPITARHLSFDGEVVSSRVGYPRHWFDNHSSN